MSNNTEGIRPTQFAPKVAPPTLPDVCPMCAFSRYRRRNAPLFRDPVTGAPPFGWVCPLCGRGVSPGAAPDNLSMYLQPQLTSIVDYTMTENGPLEEETKDAALDYANALVETFAAAHRLRPGGLSVELGTFQGTGAKLMLRAIDALYGPHGELCIKKRGWKLSDLPWLITCDPYGYKPYAEGRVCVEGGEEKIAVSDGSIYGCEAYAMAKAALAPWTNHAHYPLESFTLLQNLRSAWPYPQKERKITFALLDAEHVVGAVVGEAMLTFALDPQATLVVDNCCNDPLIIPELEKRWKVEVIHESDAVAKNGVPVPNLAVKVRSE